MKDIENPIQAKEKHIMRRNILYLLKFINHEQLRQYRQRLQPYAKRPCEL